MHQPTHVARNVCLMMPHFNRLELSLSVTSLRFWMRQYNNCRCSKLLTIHGAVRVSIEFQCRRFWTLSFREHSNDRLTQIAIQMRFKNTFFVCALIDNLFHSQIPRTLPSPLHWCVKLNFYPDDERSYVSISEPSPPKILLNLGEKRKSLSIRVGTKPFRHGQRQVLKIDSLSAHPAAGHESLIHHNYVSGVQNNFTLITRRFYNRDKQIICFPFFSVIVDAIWVICFQE